MLYMSQDNTYLGLAFGTWPDRIAFVIFLYTATFSWHNKNAFSIFVSQEIRRHFADQGALALWINPAVAGCGQQLIPEFFS